MPGTLADATLALSRPDEFLLSNDGSSRIVYLINDVVYKINRFSTGVLDFNFDEFNVINSDIVLPDNVFYPEVSLFTIKGVNVIAMDYVKGQAIYQCVCSIANDDCDPCCMTDAELNLLVDVMDDPSGFNAIRTVNGYFIIDAA